MLASEPVCCMKAIFGGLLDAIKHFQFEDKTNFVCCLPATYAVQNFFFWRVSEVWCTTAKRKNQKLLTNAASLRLPILIYPPSPLLFSQYCLVSSGILLLRNFRAKFLHVSQLIFANLEQDGRR